LFCAWSVGSTNWRVSCCWLGLYECPQGRLAQRTITQADQVSVSLMDGDAAETVGLPVPDWVIGAINFYSMTDQPFHTEAVELAEVFAS
jgi:hypothetical protein